MANIEPSNKETSIAKAIIASALLFGLNYTEQSVGQLTDFVISKYPNVTAVKLYEKVEQLVLSGYETRNISMNAVILVAALGKNQTKFY